MQERSLSPVLSHLPAVRRWVREAVVEAGLSEDRAMVLDLLTTELVSNAIRHGDGQVRVRAGRQGDQVLVAVHDTGPGMPSVRSVPTDAQGGRGLALVDVLASSWGVTGHPGAGAGDAGSAPPGGKTVWFTLAVGT